MDINSRNLGQQEEDLDKKKFRKRASMSRPNAHLNVKAVGAAFNQEKALVGPSP